MSYHTSALYPLHRHQESRRKRSIHPYVGGLLRLTLLASVGPMLPLARRKSDKIRFGREVG